MRFLHTMLRVRDLDKAMAFYQGLLGLEEVENALVAYARAWEQRRALEVAARASGTSVDLADELHRRGLASFLDVLEAQRTAYAVQRDLVQSEAQVSIQAVALYKGLGGGWDTGD